MFMLLIFTMAKIGEIWFQQIFLKIKKYAPYPYKENALTAMRMDGTKLEFDNDLFDVAFSFSSIEHFGGERHSGALKSMKEIERVLKPGGIAIIATEYI